MATRDWHRIVSVAGEITFAVTFPGARLPWQTRGRRSITYRRTLLGLFAGTALALPGSLAAQETSVVDRAETGSETPASLKAAAQAIDPLANAAGSETAWQAYLDMLETSDGPVGEQADALNRMGDARYYQQNFAGALEASLEAKSRLEEAGLTRGEAMAGTLANVATFYDANGQPERVLEMHERSMAIRTSLYGSDPAGLEPEAAKALGLGYLNYASALYARGRFSEAADLVDPSVVGLIQGQLTDATLFVALSSGANILTDAGRDVEGLAMAQRGVQLANELLPDGHPFEGFAQATLARLLRETDRYEEAEEPARRALDIMREKLGPEHPNTLTAMHNLGVISAGLGRYDEAVALTLARKDLIAQNNPADGMLSLATASNAQWEAGNAAEALVLARQAYAVAETIDAADAKAARGYEVLALRLEESGDYPGALALIEDARLTQGEAADATARQIHRGLLRIRTGDIAGGWSLVAEAAEQLEARLLSDAQRFELGADLNSYYEALSQIAEAAIAAGRPEDALAAFELASWGVNARARQFVAFQADRGEDPQLANRIAQLRSERDALRILHREWTALLAQGKTEAAAEREAEIDVLTAKVAQDTTALTQSVPGFASALRPAKPTVAQISGRLAPDQALLVAMPNRHRTLLLAITDQGAAVAETEGGRPVIRPLVGQLRAALDGASAEDVFPFDAARALHGHVMPPAIAEHIGDRIHVSLVTADALSRLPFGILLPAASQGERTDLKNADWLVRSHAFSVALAPSEAFSGSAMGGSGFLGVGAPQLSGADGGTVEGSSLYRGAEVSLEDVRALPALPEAAREIDLVAAAFEPSERYVLTGLEASEPLVRQTAGAKRAVALFATHGLLAGELGGLREPALVLTPPDAPTGTGDDGLLQASEIAKLDLAAGLVVLSACNSASGRNATAPAYTGLANAFLASGSDQLMLSHWRVRDDAAARLTVAALERSRDGEAMASALQKAQLELMADESVANAAHPAVWAPFVLIGG